MRFFLLNKNIFLHLHYLKLNNKVLFDDKNFSLSLFESSDQRNLNNSISLLMNHFHNSSLLQ